MIEHGNHLAGLDAVAIPDLHRLDATGDLRRDDHLVAVHDAGDHQRVRLAGEEVIGPATDDPEQHEHQEYPPALHRVPPPAKPYVTEMICSLNYLMT